MQSTDTTARLRTQVALATGEFMAQVVALSQRAALASLSLAFGGRGTGRTAPGAATAGAPAPKRSPAQLEEASRKFALFVRDNPGLRIEQINRHLGTTTAELMLPIRKLVADGAVATQGGRRSTKYFPGKNFVHRVLDGKKGAATVDSAAPAVPEKSDDAPSAEAAPAVGRSDLNAKRVVTAEESAAIRALKKSARGPSRRRAKSARPRRGGKK